MLAGYLAAALLVAAVAFAFIRAFNLSETIDFGWLAVGFVIAAVLLLPALTMLARSAHPHP